MAVEYGSLPFKEAVDYLTGKVNLPTRSWTDIWEGQHARAFTVAGATKEELLTDLHQSINEAITDGKTLDQFRKEFDSIVAKHGWPYKGGRNWRTRVIYETNMRTAYMAGRYDQLQQVKSRRPYWQYDHSDFVQHPRPEHEAWDGLVLHADDTWWDTHFPPNGWGCRCSVRALSKRDLARLGKDGPDKAPPLEMEEKTVGVRGPNPRTVQVPKGIDPGWGYNVGKAHSGQRLAQTAMDDWSKARDAWRPMIQKGFAEAGRPLKIPMSPLPAKLGTPLKTTAEVTAAIEDQLGAATKTYQVAGLPVVVDAQALGSHLDPSRSEYLPLLDDAISDPYEVWLNFDQHEGTGKVRLVARLIKGYDLGQGRALLVITEASGGVMLSHTMFPTGDLKYVNRQRQGQLIFAAGEDD
jgi:SPP1 gp7 family putative phage head morphogenesis protein